MNHSKYICSFLLGFVSVVHADTKTERPNILFIMSDDHACQAISSYNGILRKTLPTPNIDRIGEEGIRMELGFCTNSISTPSRASIMTGMYSNKNSVYTLNDELDAELSTFATILHESNYSTALVGKWHLGSEPQGFDYFSILPGQGRYINPEFIVKGDSTGKKFEYTSRKRINGHSTDIITNETIKWLDTRDKNKPFLMMCHFKAPHRNWIYAPRFEELLCDIAIPEPDNLYDSYESKGDYTSRMQMSMEDMKESDLRSPLPQNLSRDNLRKEAYQIYMKNYLRCIAGIDENVGRLLEYIKKHNLDENTIVIYTSDQGFFLGEHGWFDKRMMYEESLRMPLLIRYPKEIKASSVNRDNIILNIDFAPTLLDYAGIKKTPAMQGTSFRKILSGESPKNWRKAMYYRCWMHDDNNHFVPGHYGIRTNRYKLIFFYNQPLGMNGAGPNTYPVSWELYDLKKDPNEMVNLYSDKKYKSVLLNLKRQLKELKVLYEDDDDLMNCN